jgi:hypothetical protein
MRKARVVYTAIKGVDDGQQRSRRKICECVLSNGEREREPLVD